MEVINLDASKGLYIDVEYLADLTNNRLTLIRYNTAEQDKFQTVLLSKYAYLLNEKALTEESIQKQRNEFKEKALKLYQELYWVLFY